VRGQAVHTLMVAQLAPVVAAKAFFASGAPLEMARIVKVAFDCDAPTRVYECEVPRCSPGGRVLGLKTERLGTEARLEAPRGAPRGGGGGGGGGAADGVCVGACVSISATSTLLQLIRRQFVKQSS
jgi:hypothetical protein